MSKKICAVSALMLCFALPVFAGAKKDTYKPEAKSRSVAVVYSQEEQVDVAMLGNFSSYKSQFDLIMLLAMADCIDANFSLAAKEFTAENQDGQSSLTMGRDRFIAENFPRSVVNTVDSAVSQAKNAVNEIQNIQRRLEKPYSDFISAVNDKNLRAAENAYNQAERYFSQIVQSRNAVRSASQSVKSLYQEYIRQGTRDCSYLFSLAKLLAGLDGTVGSGLAGVFDQLYDAYVGGMKNALVGLMQSDFDAFTLAVTKREGYEAARTSLSSINATSSLAQKISQGSGDSKITNAVPLARYADSLLSDYILYENLMQTKAGLSSSADAELSSEFTKTASSLYDLQVKSENALKETWLVNFPKNEWTKEIDAYKNACAYLAQNCAASSSELWRVSAERMVSDAQTFVRRDKMLLGEVQASSDQPKNTLAQIQALVQTLNSDRASVASYIQTLSSRTQSSYISSLESSRQSLDDLIREAEILNKEASELTSRAYQAQLDGDRLYSEAETAFNRRDYNTALERLESAAEKYDESLAIQNDDDIRYKRDTTLLDLSNRIARSKYENIVREVRTLKDTATTLYYSGEFEAAEASLNRAEQLWTDITVEVDDELERLKTLVNTALTMNIGRVLSTDDPLYPEMSQILSVANQYYSQGVTLKNQGKDKDAEASLNLAKQKLEELQRVYPLNQDASILTLRINRLLDPVEFERSFESRVKTLSAVDYSARNAFATQSYTELKDLYVINPSYPGLASVVNEAEIALGLKQRPVTVTSSQRAATIARDAQSILSRAGGDEDLLEQARQRAEEALELDPNNAVAKNVLDEVKLQSGSQDSGVLSSEDEEQFQRAKQLFKNNYIEEAYAVVSALWQKNPSSKRIKNLKERIELKL